MRALYRDQVILHGGCATMSLFPVFPTGRRRGRRYRPTNDVQQRLNEFNAWERLGRQLDAYMNEGDGFWRLTFRNSTLPKTREEAMRIYQAFRRRLIRYYKNEGLGVFMMAAVHHGDAGDQRLHLHIVINADIPAGTMAKLWGQGSVETRALYKTKRGFRGLAEYMMKKMLWGRVMTTRNMRDPEAIEHTGKISKAKVQEIYENWDNKDAYEGIMPGYRIAEVKPFYNWFNKYYYLRIYLYREDWFSDGSS